MLKPPSPEPTRNFTGSGAMLAESLKGVISQQLVPRADGRTEMDPGERPQRDADVVPHVEAAHAGPAFLRVAHHRPLPNQQNKRGNARPVAARRADQAGLLVNEAERPADGGGAHDRTRLTTPPAAHQGAREGRHGRCPGLRGGPA